MAKVLKTRVLSLLVAVALAVAALPLALTPAVAAVPNRMFIHPATQTVSPGSTFTVEVRMDTNLITRGGQTDIRFNHELVEVIGVAVGGMYPGGMLLHGSIAEANTTGTLRGVAVMMVPGNRPPTTGGVYVIISMRARAGVVGTPTSPLTLSEAVAVDLGGRPVSLTLAHGKVEVTGPAGDMPDLIVKSVLAPWVVEGTTYNVIFTVKNQGKAVAAASTAAIFIDGVAKPTVAIPVLAVGASETRTVGPFTLSDLSDTIRVIADSLNVVVESDGGNNALERILLGVPDLIVHTVVATWVVEGETYNVSLNVKNVGRGKAPASIAAIRIDGREVATADIPVVAPGMSHPPIPVGPFTLTAGSDTITVAADAPQVVTELREDNNTKETVVRVIVVGPVFRPDHRLFISPATQTVRPGETFTVRVMQDTPRGRGSSAAVATFRFNQLLLEVTDVALGAAYTGAVFSHGDIPAANRDAFLAARAAMPPGVVVPGGEQEFLVITMRVRGDPYGRERIATLTLLSADLTMVGPADELIRPAGIGGEVVIPVREAPWAIIGGVIGGAALLAVGIVLFALQRKKRRLLEA